MIWGSVPYQRSNTAAHIIFSKHAAREMGVTAPWENTVDIPARRPIQVSNLQPTERDGLELCDVERVYGTSQPAANHPTPVEDTGMFYCSNNNYLMHMRRDKAKLVVSVCLSAQKLPDLEI